MANFIIVGSDYLGFGSKTIKIKPSSVNTSNITEKKGKLVIRVNGEVQRTIPLSQAVKASTPETPETVTLISREISLELQEISTTSINAEFKEVDTNSASQPITKSHTINKKFTSNRDNNSSRARVEYSVQGIQTDYFSDGSNVKTYLYPDMSLNSDDPNWIINYPPNKPGDPTLLFSQRLVITSVLVLGSLPTSNRSQFTFTLNDVKTPKANVSYGMTLKVQCTLVITVKTLDVHIPIIPSNPDKPIDPDMDPHSDDPTYNYGN